MFSKLVTEWPLVHQSDGGHTPLSRRRQEIGPEDLLDRVKITLVVKKCLLVSLVWLVLPCPWTISEIRITRLLIKSHSCPVWTVKAPFTFSITSQAHPSRVLDSTEASPPSPVLFLVFLGRIWICSVGVWVSAVCRWCSLVGLLRQWLWAYTWKADSWVWRTGLLWCIDKKYSLRGGKFTRLEKHPLLCRKSTNLS